MNSGFHQALRQKDKLLHSWLAILVGSISFRLMLVAALGSGFFNLPGTADQLSYHTLALRVNEGEHFTFAIPWWPATSAEAPTAHWSYLYTYYLAAVYVVFGVNPLVARLIQSVIVAILHPLLAYLLGQRVFGETVGLVAAGITAVYAYFVYYSATLMTEPFYLAAILASLYLAVRIVDQAGEGTASAGSTVALGMVLGCAVLLRQVFLLFVPLLLLWAWWASGRKLAWRTLIPGAVVVAFILPFTAFNAIRFDRFVLLNTNAGFAFFWANHPIYGTEFEPILPDEMGSYQELIPEELRDLDEAALDSELLRHGIGFVLEDPLRYLRLSISRIPAYFMFWPSSASSTISNISRVLSFGVTLPFMLYGLAKAWFGRGAVARRDPVGLLTLFAVVYSAIHLLSWSLIRYRLPVDAVLVIFASEAVVDIARRLGVIERRAMQPA